MKKGWLIAAAVLVLIGALLFTGALMSVGWDLTALGEKTESVSLEIPEPFRNITIRSDTEEIRFLPTEDGVCRVTFREREKERHTAAVENGTLTIGKTDARQGTEFLSFSFESPEITLYLPQRGYGALAIEESTGDVMIPKDFTFESIQIDASTGDVDCSASVSGEARIALSTGDIRMEDVSAGALDLTVTTGKVTVRGAVCTGDVHVGVSTGKAMLKELRCRNLRSEGNTGDLTMENVLASEGVAIERSTGDVRFEACDAAELTVKTGTGDVTGTLLSDKVFLTQIHTGRVEVPKAVVGGKCEITTDTGDILLSVSEASAS
jgi:DUF4097 and DUF4098 domain-containing protein YvlB